MRWRSIIVRRYRDLIYTYLYEVIVGDGEWEDGGVVGYEGGCGQEC